jgi:transglutaminase-like putative cysteine protease
VVLFEGEHLTRFTYTGPVYVEPMTVRLRPRDDAAQRLLRFEASVTPEPGGISQMTDVEGNTAIRLWFEGVTDVLEIRTSFEVRTLRANPFDYVVGDPAVLQVPLLYPDAERAAIRHYRRVPDDESVVAFAHEVLNATESRAASFLDALTRRIAGEFRHVIRPSGDALPPRDTLAARTGACRDLTVLFIEACRSIGIAARFVSGYQDPGDVDAERELHAWAEVYLPGGGWRGYDPSAGIAVADHHVALAAGPTPRDAAPTEGTFRGNNATSSLETKISLHVTD